jgi:uncharacterized protein (TIGR02271 family)
VAGLNRRVKRRASRRPTLTQNGDLAAHHTLQIWQAPGSTCTGRSREATMNIHRDASVEHTGREVGRVEHVIVDPDTREVMELVVEGDGQSWRLPIDAVEVMDGARVMLRGDRPLNRVGRPFRREDYESVPFEHARDGSRWQAVHGGRPLLNAGSDAVHVGDTDSPVIQPALQRDGDMGEYRLRLREERPRLSTELVPAGVVRAHKRVVDRIESLEVPVHEEWLVIEHVSGQGRVMLDGRELGPGESIEIPLRRDRVIVRTEVQVSEDVTIGTRWVEHHETVNATLRHEELAVDDPGGFIAESDETGTGGERSGIFATSDGGSAMTGDAGGSTPAPDRFRADMEAHRLRVAEEQAAAGLVPSGPLVSDSGLDPLTGAADDAPDIGTPLVTEDGEPIGTVADVRAEQFKVNAPFERDYWLPLSLITGTAPGGDLIVGVTKHALDDEKLDEE